MEGTHRALAQRSEGGRHASSSSSLSNPIAALATTSQHAENEFNDENQSPNACHSSGGISASASPLFSSKPKVAALARVFDSTLVGKGTESLQVNLNKAAGRGMNRLEQINLDARIKSITDTMAMQTSTHSPHTIEVTKSNENSREHNSTLIDTKGASRVGGSTQTQRETRRQIMLQERRMQRVASLRCCTNSSFLPIEPQSADEKRCLGDAPTYSYIQLDKESTQKRLKTHHQCSPKNTTSKETTNPHEANILKFLCRFLLICLALYEVQCHCVKTSRFISSCMSLIDLCLRELLSWIGTSFLNYGYLSVASILIELRNVFSRGIYCSTCTVLIAISSSDLLHVVFVLAFLIRGIASSISQVRDISTRQGREGKYQRWKRIYALSGCWIMILPLFSECDSGDGDFCFFVQTANTQSKSNVRRVTSNISSPRYSSFDVMAMKMFKAFSIFVRAKVKGRLVREIQCALFNPFKFHGRLKKIFMIIRWTKFLAPLIGTCNKLRGNIVDMMKKKRQHITSKFARKMWSDAIGALSSKSKTERAVLLIQKSFRERREMKAKRRFSLLSSNRPHAHHIRKRLREERMLSRSKLVKMEIDNEQRRLRRQVSKDERINMLKHKEKLKHENRKLLLSPKTAFSVGWKCVAISCVVLEVSQILFSPLLSGELKKLPLDQFLSTVLFESCEKKKRSRSSKYVSNNFCIYHSSTSVSSRIIVPLVDFVCFLDVFITFFTGELSSTGRLIPKPFFPRYILPGIGLQLIVNPTMVPFSRFVKQVLEYSIHIGPSLCVHLLLPCLSILAYSYETLVNIVFDFVDRQNQFIIRQSCFE